MIFRIYHKQVAEHIEMRVFAGEDGEHLAHCGDLVMRGPEFHAFKRWTFPRVQYVEDEGFKFKEELGL